MEALRERFGKYHVLEKIAQGGMAEVYKVKTIGIAGFEKVQALKRILPSSAREGRFIRSFIDEARIAVELTHRNIVQVFDFGKADGELFMAMELIEGRDLRTAMTQAVARDFLCPIPVAAFVIGEVAAGLDYAHRKTDGYGGTLGIVHCDVSPSNVMLSADGYVKILDFGIARASFSSALERRRLRGKPRYMAPEQTLGEPPTAQADVFALGIIAWELFTGLPLYRGHDIKSILEAVRRTDPPRVDRMNPNVPAEIVEAIATALNREPPLRGTAADLAAACSRAALTSGARQLATWLGELDARAGSASLSLTSTPASVSVPKASITPTMSVSANTPPVRPSTRSLSGAIANPAAPHDFGEGTPGDMDVLPLAERTATALIEHHHRFAPEPTASIVTSIAQAERGMSDHERASTYEPYRREPTASISTHAPFGHDMTGSVIAPPPPPREATASIVAPAPREPTASISTHAPFGHDMTGSVIAPPPPPSEATASIVAPAPREPTASISTHAPFGHDMTGSVIAPPPPPSATTTPFRREPAIGEPEASVTAAAPRGFDFDVTTSATRPAPNWGAERTTEGVGRLQDALDAVDASREQLPTETATPALRPSYERFIPMAGTNPNALRFDDDATQFALPSVGEATSFDDLEVENSLEAPVDDPVLADEPIDDDLAALAAPTMSERRRTVVVAALLEGAERDVLRPITRSLGELAYQRGGVVLRLDDDQLLVAFGLEVAGEDDVAIAMGWALDAASMTRDEHGGLRLRIGARTGVATSHGGPGDDEPFGGGTTTTRIPHEAIDDARALAREAAPDRPLFVGVAGRVTSGLYELREVPASTSRARIRRGRVIEVIGPRSFGDRDRQRLERRGKFVGRTVQLAELDAWYQRAIAADRRLTVLVTGAAGTGKSRLVAELVARRTSGGQPVRVIMTAANPASRLAPFALVIELYQAALGLPPARGRAGRAQLVQRLLHLMKEAGAPDARARAVATDLDRAMELRDGVGLATPEVADLRPRISAGLAAFRAAMTDRQPPRLTILEDVHLADSASLEVLRHALAVTQMGPELLVLTARPEGPQPPAVDVTMTVGDLVGGELRALITDRLGEAATPLNIAAVIARGGGNPLFIEELAQAVREAGDDVPASARDVVAARVDRLTAKAKTALRFAAVLGGAVRARLLEELMGEENLETELDELVEAGFFVRPEAAAHSSEGELQFARGLVREVIYESLSARAQRESHARVGRLLASRFFAGREEPPAVIAEHMERGGELAAAAAFWLRAAKLSVAASDAGAAALHFTRVIAIERELGATPPTATSRARRREAFAGREEAHRMLGDLVSDPGDIDELARLAGGEPRRLADVAIRRAHRALRLGDYAQASVATVVAEDHAMAIDDLRLRGEALRVRSEILERLGRFDEALVVVEDARLLFAREGAVADEMAAMVGAGRIHLMRAHYEAARAAYMPAIQRIEKTGDPWLERIVQNHVAIIEMCLGNFGLAMQSAQRSLELCRRYGDRAREGDALSVAGIILLEVGLYDHAAASFAEALELLSRTASRWSRADCLIYAGVCDVRRGRDGGIALLDEALAEARRLGARYLEANALISRAGAQLRRGQLAAAAEDAADGTAVARAATLVGYEIQGLARHAVALVRGGGHTGAAAGLVDRALALLDQQRYLEGSEEEVYANCVEVLAAAGAHDHAAAVKAHGRAEVLRKLAGLSELPDPAWRLAYASIAENKALLT